MSIEEIFSIPTQPPCDWCLGGFAIACTCSTLCSEARCPFAESDFYAMQPVPQFVKVLGQLIRVGKKEPKVVKFSKVQDEDAPAAVKRIVDLHSPCCCTRCQAPVERPCCQGCVEYWPCSTARAVQGIPMVFEVLSEA